MNKDWNGNSKSTFVTLGASSHTEHDRAEHDYYSTDPKALEIFLDRIKEDNITLHNKIWESACGEGHLSKVLENRGYQVFSSDLVDRGFGKVQDFLNYENQNKLSVDILTNPPYKCFDIGTQCYTKRGWLKYNELNKEDEVLSVNPYTQEVEWSKINKIIIRDLDINEKVYHFKKARIRHYGDKWTQNVCLLPK